MVGSPGIENIFETPTPPQDFLVISWDFQKKLIINFYFPTVIVRISPGIPRQRWWLSWDLAILPMRSHGEITRKSCGGDSLC